MKVQLVQYCLSQALGHWDLEVNCLGTFPFLIGVATSDEKVQTVERIV